MIPMPESGRRPVLPCNLSVTQDPEWVADCGWPAWRGRRGRRLGTHTGDSSGFGLLEALVAVAILGVAAAILIAASRTSVAGQQRSRVYGDAATAVKEALEGLQLLSLDSLSRLADAALPHSQGAKVEVRATARGVRPADVADFAALDTSSLRHVTLTAVFPGQTGAPVRKTFSTIVYRP